MLTALEKQLIQELQTEIPLVSRPFLALAQKLNLSEEEILAKIKDLANQGYIRRFGAIVNHQQVGYVVNAMVVWQVPEEQIKKAGKILASFPEVTHCYARPSQPGWPYNLYTMIHGKTHQECQEIINRLRRASEIKNYCALFTAAELKKSKMKYLPL
jgi:DNA-binding Lrp family transcriptional regulator